MNIGIYAADSRPGRDGGADIYTRGILEALADHEPRHAYVVLVDAASLASWNFRTWPRHVQFRPLQPPGRQLCRRAARRLNLPVSEPGWEAHFNRQVRALGLDLLHYPRTLIPELAVEAPCVLTFFDMQHEYHPEFFTADERSSRAQTHRPAAEKAVRIIAPSLFTAQTLKDTYGIPESKISVVPVGIAETFVRCSEQDARRVREKYGLPEAFLYYPANPWPHKNHARLMRALALCAGHHGLRMPLVLSGRLPTERRDALQPALAAGVESLVTDLTFVDQADLPALYSAARLLVFPSLFEGFGIPLLEAMACGCPIAAARATAIPECVGDAALLFDPLDPAAMADAMARLWTEAPLRETLRERGLRRSRLFEWKRVVPQLVAAYERAVGSR